jgi:type II secretory pathway component PulK
MQGRFNLNNLGPDHARRQNPGPRAARNRSSFSVCLIAVGLEPKWAGIARDWIDADDMPGNPDGAEDSVYTSQTPPYRTGNWPMTSPHRTHEPAGIRRRPLSKNCALRHGFTHGNGDQ